MPVHVGSPLGRTPSITKLFGALDYYLFFDDHAPSHKCFNTGLPDPRLPFLRDELKELKLKYWKSENTWDTMPELTDIKIGLRLANLSARAIEMLLDELNPQRKRLIDEFEKLNKLREIVFTVDKWLGSRLETFRHDCKRLVSWYEALDRQAIEIKLLRNRLIELRLWLKERTRNI